MNTIHIIIKGKVQGVFYRASAKEKAISLGLTGWVKNTAAGNVEVMASGGEESLDAFVNWCKGGPENAIVSNVEVLKTSTQTFHSFDIQKGLGIG